ncbi:MAG: hypothetical protein JWN14_4303 [Chthonomonadales bacterium]|nr:hypothetical protein [Chthonomonadales bacterium]
MQHIDIVPGQARPRVTFYGSDRRQPPTVSYQPPTVSNQPNVEEPAEREPRPYMTYLLTAINVGVFLLMMAVGHGKIDAVAEMFGAKVNFLIQQGQWWRLLTPVFLHGSVVHLLTNSLSLIWFGSSIEKLYGARKYLVIYFIAGIAGNIASYMHSPALSLGASGAIFGLVGAGLMFPIRFRSLLPPGAPKQILNQILPIAVINLFIGSTTPSIDNWAHMGGLAGGAIVALFLIPDALTERHPSRIQSGSLSAVCLCLLMVTLLAGFKQWKWATRNYVQVQPLAIYEIDSPAWWHIGIPTDWKPVQGATAWTGPKGNRLDILDSSEDARLLAEAQATSERVKPNINVDGHPAWQIRAQIGGETSDVFLIPIYGRIVELIFHPSDYANLRYVTVLSQILGSIHFEHAPANVIQPPATR